MGFRGPRRESRNQVPPGAFILGEPHWILIAEVARMPTRVQTAVCSLFTVGILLLAAACQIEPWPANATREVPSGREPNAAVTGTVTYRERLALTPGATLVVELRDVSYADAHAPLIARPDHHRPRPSPPPLQRRLPP